MSGDRPTIRILDWMLPGLDASADDYLFKPFKFKELLARICAVLRRRHLRFTRQLRAGDLTVDPETRQVFTRDTLLNRIWGSEPPSCS